MKAFRDLELFNLEITKKEFKLSDPFRIIDGFKISFLQVTTDYSNNITLLQKMMSRRIRFDIGLITISNFHKLL